MKTGAPLCARGRVRALRGLRRTLCERGLCGPFQRLGCSAARAGEVAVAGRAPGRPGDRGMGVCALPLAAGPSMIKRWRPPPACELRVPR